MLWLFYVESLSAKEIAQITGRSWVAVKTGMSRARAKLGKAIERRGGAPTRAPKAIAASVAQPLELKAGEP